jgi:hypothetical protein
MGGGDDADVHGDGFLAAEALEAFFLEDAHEFDLGAEGHVADFVEEDGAAAGLFEAANAAGLGAGKGTAFMAEEFAFEEGFGDGGAVDGDEGGVGAVAVLVDGAGDEFLAGAGFAADEDVDGSGGDAADFLVDGLHGGALADEGGAGGAGFAEDDRLGHEAVAVGSAADEIEHWGDVEGLEQVVVSAELDGFDGGFGGAEGGNEDDGEARLGGVQLADQLESVETG